MKKVLLLVTVMLIAGVAIYARSGYGVGGCCPGYGYSTSEGEQFRIKIQEKNLEIRKELLKASPDWSKVEKLNSEIAIEQGKLRTEMQKYMRNNY